MHYFDLPHACVLLLAAWLGEGAVATPNNGLPTHRVLRAATKRTDLYRRSMRISKQFQSELAYTEEENGWNGRSTFASQVKVKSQKPIMNLEEMEHHLQDVQCGDGRIKMSFVDTSSARDAYHSCHEKDGGLIITSHDSCNDEGERAVYRVHDVSFADEGEALELTVTEAQWQDAFDHFDIAFGHTTDDHLFRRHSDFAKIRKKRQSLDIPDNTPDSVNAITLDLASQLIDTTFAAESFLLGLEQLVPIPALPIEIGCNNCSTRGRVALTQGAIQIDVSQIDVVPDVFEGGDDGKEITSVITGGFIELAATGVGAHLDLFARPKVSGAFEITLFPLPILGFVIPGIGRAGAVFEPRIAVDFEISGGFELNYGVDVAIPDDSNIRLELANIANSKANGFPGSTLTPLPFISNVTGVDVLLGLAFKPTIPVGFQFNDKLKAEVFVSMNLPRLDAKLSTNAAADCGNGTNTTVPSAPYTNTTTDISEGLAALGPLVLVGANISVTVDVGIGLSFPLLPPPFGDVGIEANIFSTAFPLVTSCVNAGDAFASVTATVGTMPSVSSNTTVVPAATTTIYKTSTKTHTLTAHVTKSKSNHTMTSSHVVKGSIIPSETPIPVPPAQQSSVSNSSIISIASSSVLSNVTVTPAAITLPATPAAPSLPASTVIMSSGFLSPGNTTIAPAQQTSPAVFTGAAVHGAEISKVWWKIFGAQMGVIGMSVLFGAIVL